MHTNAQKEDLHISYISALCAVADISYDIQRHDDDSTDGIIKKRIFLEHGGFFDSLLRIQLKSTSSKSKYADHGDHISYQLKVKNYNDLCTPSTTPIILGLFILPDEETNWIHWTTKELLIRGCMYWADFTGQKPSENKSEVTVTLEKSHVINQHSLLDILTKIAKEEWP